MEVETLRKLLERVLDDATGEALIPEKRVWPIRATLYREIHAAIGYEYDSARAMKDNPQDTDTAKKPFFQSPQFTYDPRPVSVANTRDLAEWIKVKCPVDEVKIDWGPKQSWIDIYKGGKHAAVLCDYPRQYFGFCHLTQPVDESFTSHCDESFNGDKIEDLKKRLIEALAY